MATQQTCRASEDSPGYCLIIEKGQVYASFFCLDVTAVYPNTDSSYVRGGTVISFRRDVDDGFWLATFCSVAAVQAAIDDAIALRKKARPIKVRVKKAAAASG